VSSEVTTFDKIVDSIKRNGWRVPERVIWHYKDASLVDAPALQSISAPGLMVYRWTLTHKVEYRAGNANRLIALAAELAHAEVVGPAASRPGEFPQGHPLAVDPAPESGFRRFANTSTAINTAITAAPEGVAMPVNPSVSAASPEPANIMCDEEGR
jgi:hypothetical protein